MPSKYFTLVYGVHFPNGFFDEYIAFLKKLKLQKLPQKNLVIQLPRPIWKIIHAYHTHKHMNLYTPSVKYYKEIGQEDFYMEDAIHELNILCLLNGTLQPRPRPGTKLRPKLESELNDETDDEMNGETDGETDNETPSHHDRKNYIIEHFNVEGSPTNVVIGIKVHEKYDDLVSFVTDEQMSEWKSKIRDAMFDFCGREPSLNFLRDNF